MNREHDGAPPLDDATAISPAPRRGEPAVRPPALAVRLADRLVDARVREAVVGDLVESFDARVSELGPAGARAWFWRHALLTIAHFPPRPRLPHSAGDGLVTGFLDDLARAARALRRAPAFTVACAATLGIGIGAATAIFSVADPIILRPLPYPSPDKIVVAWENDAQGQNSRLGYETIVDVRNSARTLERTSVVRDWGPTLFRDGKAELLTGQRVSWSYFATLGVRPAIGRDFNADEDAQATNAVVILSHEYWNSRFGGDTAVVGSAITLGTRSYTVDGVMPAGYDDVMAPGTQIWGPLGYETSLPYACRSCRHLRMIARVRADASLAAAAAELNVISARIVRDHPQDYPAAGFHLVPLQYEVTRSVRPALTALLVAVALLLLIAIVNVAGLQLARALQRDEEFAVRAALGAGGGRLTRLLVAEGLVLAFVSGVAGWAVARVGVDQLVARLPAGIPRLDVVHLDWRTYSVAVIVMVASGLAVGLVPAWHARRRALAVSLRGGRRVGGAPHRVRAVLVVTEVALAVVLLAGAGLLARSLTRLLSVDAGVDLNTTGTAQVQVSGPQYATNDAVYAWQDQLIEAARAIPGVQSAALTSQLPLGGNFDSYGVQARDKPLDNPELAPDADRYTVTADFLRTMQIPVVSGRDFDAADNGITGAPVAIVSQALATRIWGSESAVDKQIHLGEPTRPWYTVIGVARDIHHRGLDVEATRQVYIPTRRFFFTDDPVDVVVRTTGDPAVVLPALRRAVMTPNATSVITRLATMRDVLSGATAQRRLALILFTVFASIALLLAAAGIFGALAGTVTERRREIGLRSALGATPGEIVRLVLGQGAGLAAGGVLIGLAVAFVSTKAISGMLFGVGSGDIVTISGVAIVIGVAAVAASAIPAWRAMRVDPITALRAD